MAERTAKTNLEIKADLRQLKVLERTLNDVFNSKAPSAFTKTVATVTKRLEDNAKEHERIVKAMGEVKRSSAAYRDLERDLKSVNRETRELAKSLLDVNRLAESAGARMARNRSMGGGGRGGGGFGGGGGIPNAQLPMPGVGGLIAAMAGIPVVGAMAGGSLQAAAATYQTRLAYEGARMGAAPYLMRARDAVSYKGLTRTVVDRGPIALGVGKKFKDMAGQWATMGAQGLSEAEIGAYVQTTQQANNRAMYGETVGGMLNDAQGRASMMAESVGLGKISRAQARKMIADEQQIARDAIAKGMDPAKAWRLPGISDFARYGAANLGMEGTGVNLPNRRKTETIIGNRPFDDRAYREAGLSLGMDPSEAITAAGELARAAGRVVGPEEFLKASAMGRLFGVDRGAMGKSFAAAGRTGNDGTADGLAKTLSKAIVLGLEGSEITEYLQAQTQFLERQANQGVKFELGGLYTIENSLKGMADPYRAQQISQGFAGYANQVGMKGVSSAIDMRLAEAFGYTGKGGMNEYAETMFRMQKGQGIEQALPQFMEAFMLPGDQRNSPFQALILQRALSAANVGIGEEEARQLAAGAYNRSGEGTFDPQAMVDAAVKLVGATAGNVREEARIKAEQVGIGANIAPTMQKFQRITNDLASSLQNTFGGAIEKVAGQMEEWSQKMERWTDGEWTMSHALLSSEQMRP